MSPAPCLPTSPRLSPAPHERPPAVQPIALTQAACVHMRVYAVAVCECARACGNVLTCVWGDIMYGLRSALSPLSVHRWAPVMQVLLSRDLPKPTVGLPPGSPPCPTPRPSFPWASISQRAEEGQKAFLLTLTWSRPRWELCPAHLLLGTVDDHQLGPQVLTRGNGIFPDVLGLGEEVASSLEEFPFPGTGEAQASWGGEWGWGGQAPSTCIRSGEPYVQLSPQSPRNPCEIPALPCPPHGGAIESEFQPPL